MNKAFLIVDLQNDFMPDGALSIKGGDKIVPRINRLMQKFSIVIATQDWHPAHHLSFAKSHGKNVGEVVDINGSKQELWPVHCVQHTLGSQVVNNLNHNPIQKYIYKGTDKEIDSYSAFFDNDGLKKTGLDCYLKEKKVTQLYIAGLTTDYCILYSVLDAIKLEYEVFVIQDCCRPVYDDKVPFQKMKEVGAHIINSKDL